MHQKHRQTLAIDRIGELDRLGRRRVRAKTAGEAPIVLFHVMEIDMNALRDTTQRRDEGIGQCLCERAPFVGGHDRRGVPLLSRAWTSPLNFSRTPW